MAGYYFYPKHQSQEMISDEESKLGVLEQARDSSFTVHSIQGMVTNVNGNNFSFKTTLIQNGNPVTLEKIAILSEQTQVVIKNKNNLKESKATLKDIQVNQDLIFYTTTYPYDQQKISPYKVEILK